MFSCTLHIRRSIHCTYWPNYTLHTAHCTFHDLYTEYTDPSTYYTLHSTHYIESLVHARSGRVEWQPREGLHSTVLCFTTPHWVCYCNLLYFTAIYGTILLNIEDQHCFILVCNVRLLIRSWSFKLSCSCSYYLLCLLLSLIYCLMTLCLWESWRRNCLWKIIING